MITFTDLFLAAACAAILAIWMRNKSDYALLAHYFVALAPLLPVISLLDHNLDHNRMSPLVRVLPFHLISILLLLTVLFGHSPTKTIKTPIALLLYCILTLAQIPLCRDPAWAFTHWSYTVPGYILFFYGGAATKHERLTKLCSFLNTVIAYTFLTLSLIAFGMATGKASDIFRTRNFGSVFASNGVLTFLSLYGSLAWMAARRSFGTLAILLAFVSLVIVMSISRTSVFVVSMFVALVFTLDLRQTYRLAIAGISTVLLAIVAIGGLEAITSLDISGQLQENWTWRFSNGSNLADNYEHAISHRHYLFALDWEDCKRHYILHGAGFGHYSITTRSDGEFTNCHNTFLMEWFENGLPAAVALYVAMGAALVKCCRVLTSHARSDWPIAFGLPVFFAIAHTTGAELSSRNGLTTYFTPACGWMASYLMGVIDVAVRHAALNCESPGGRSMT